MLTNPAVDVAIVGSRRTAHIDDALTALDVELTSADIAAIDRIMAGAVPVGGPLIRRDAMTGDPPSIAVVGTGMVEARTRAREVPDDCIACLVGRHRGPPRSRRSRDGADAVCTIGGSDVR